MPWDLSPDDVVALPLEELALRVLENYHEDPDSWHWGNWVAARKVEYGHRQHREAIKALHEAWAWIFNHGLVVRDPDRDSDDGCVLLSRQGAEALARGIPWLRATQRLDVELVDVLAAKARPLFLRGEFEAAVFMAMKEVEVAVRELAGLDTSLIGTRLMQEAFRPPRPADGDAGLLHQAGVDQGEAVATMELYKGAIGLFKNPSSHRPVDFDDPTEAAEVILLADLLLRLLRRNGG